MFTFSKEERLCNKRLISGLYHNGSSFLVYPLRIQWQVVEQREPISSQVLFSVPKRTFKKAVSRNVLKRRIREAYRLHRQAVFTGSFLPGKTLLIAFHYIAKDELAYATIEKKMITALDKLLININPKTDEGAE